MRQARARWAVAAVAVAVTGPLAVAAAPPAAATTTTVPGCPSANGARVKNTPATFPRTVALTFDDGPDPVWTAQVLAVLAKHRVHATFFVIGRRAAAFPEALQQIVDAGHAVGNHTWDHPTNGAGMYALSREQLITEFDPTTALIKDVTGRPVCFFRAPQGKDDTPTIRQLARQRGQTVTGYYTASDYLQPRRPDPAWVARIEQRLEGKGPHPVLLMHDGGVYRGNTVRALDAIITWYAARGYVFTDPAGRPFAGELPAGGKVPASGWAIPLNWTPPQTGLTASSILPTDLPAFGPDSTLTDPTDTDPTGSDPTGTGSDSTGTGSPATGATDPGTASSGPGSGSAPGDPTSGELTAGSGATAPADGSPAVTARLATLGAKSSRDPLAARQLSDAVARYLMLFSAPPA